MTLDLTQINPFLNVNTFIHHAHVNRTKFIVKNDKIIVRKLNEMTFCTFGTNIHATYMLHTCCIQEAYGISVTSS